MFSSPIRLLCGGLVLASAQLAAQTPERVMGAPFHTPSRAFIDLMIPHHEMAIMMSEHHLPKLTSDSAKAFTRRMIENQKREMAELKAARRALFGSDSAREPAMKPMMQMMMAMHGDTAGRAGRDTAHAMHGRTPAQPADTMHRMHQGPPPPQPRPLPPGASMGNMAAMGHQMPMDMQRMFFEHMIRHHTDGIDMSVLAEDSQAAARVKELARRIREGQEKEIAEMRRLLGATPAAPHKH